MVVERIVAKSASRIALRRCSSYSPPAPYSQRRVSLLDVEQNYARIRWGLCCQFVEQPIHFRTTTATSLLRLNLAARRQKLSDICLANAEALLLALQFCATNGIGCFRVNSQILPAKTHPEAGYAVEDLPRA